MPATVTFICDRDGTAGESNSPLPPKDWTMLSCSKTNATAGVATSRVVLCPACSDALVTFMGDGGKTMFAPPPPAVPMET
jgi:hypothetical protein